MRPQMASERAPLTRDGAGSAATPLPRPGFSPRLRSLASDTAIYGVANVLARALSFLLVPLHTNLLTPAEYGPIGTLYGYIVVFAVLYGLGLETAYLRYAAPDRRSDGRDAFSTTTLCLAICGLSATLGITLWREAIARWIGLPGLGHFVAAAAWIVLLDTLPLAALAWLRLRRRAALFAAIRLCSVALYVALTWLLLVRLRHGAFAILEANLAASAAELLLVLPVLKSQLRLRIDMGLLRKLLAFSRPLVPAGLAGVVLLNADRPILQKLADDATVGMYQASAKLAFPMLLLVTVFQYAWQPIFLSRAQDRDARPLFARVIVYQLAAALGLFLVLSLFADLALRLPVGAGHTFISRDYWQGVAVVPWLALAYAAYGIYASLGAGPTLCERTWAFAWVAIPAAALNVGLGIALAPAHGMLGVAYATCLAALAAAGLMGLVSQRLYPLDHEWTRLLRVALLGLSPWLLFRWLGGSELPVAARLGLLALYPLGLGLSGFFRSGELAWLRALYRSSEAPVLPPKSAAR